MFFAHPEAYPTIKSNPDVILIDATYKTNNYNMPLLQTVSVTCMNTVYNVCFGFMGGEGLRYYAWHMRAHEEFFDWLGITTKHRVTDLVGHLKAAITTIFHSVQQRLCLWHINKNVQGKAMKAWDVRMVNTDEEKEQIDEERLGFMGRWYQLVEMGTGKLFWDDWTANQGEYKACPALLDYLSEHQILFTDQ